MRLSNGNNNVAQMTPFENAYLKYKGAIGNLLIVLAFTAINVIMCAAGSNTYFLFSASVPYFVASVGQALYLKTGVSSYIWIFAVVAVSLLIPYLICWIFAKKHYGFMIAAFVYFIIDSLLFVWMVLSADSIASSVFDLVFHVYVIVCLVNGVKYGATLKKLTNGEMLAVDISKFMENNAENQEQTENAESLEDEVCAESEENADDNEN